MEIVADPAFLDEVGRKAGPAAEAGGAGRRPPGRVRGVRGAGLMLGLKCKATNTDVVAAGYAEQVLTVPAADNVIRLLPPLNISDAEIAEAVDRLDRAAARLKAQPPEPRPDYRRGLFPRRAAPRKPDRCTISSTSIPPTPPTCGR
jgi:acetylornithine/N-succinyldiaminopimelate aminotransferase